MSNLRRPPGPVRQLSLQQPPRRQQVRRQRSAEEDNKPLQVFANPIRNRLQCQDGKVDPGRPKVRVAWDDNNQDSVENDVAVIARQIPGKLRPPTARTKVTTRPAISEKASILYSRQELAERLRLAWKQREENRANIDIFLAQNAVESNCDSRPSSCAASAPSSGIRRRETVTEPRTNRISSRVTPSSETTSCTSVTMTTPGKAYHQGENIATSLKPSLNAMQESENGIIAVTKVPTDALMEKLEISTERASDQGLIRVQPAPNSGTIDAVAIFEDIEEGRVSIPDDDQIAPSREPLQQDRDEHQDMVEGESRPNGNVTVDDVPSSSTSIPKKRDQDGGGVKESLATSSTMSAKAKRANFSNNSLHSQRVSTSGSATVTPGQSTTERRERIQVPTQITREHNYGSSGVISMVETGRMRRTNSAPPVQHRRQSSGAHSAGAGGRTQVSIVIDAPSIGPSSSSSSQETKPELGAASEALVKGSPSISNRAIKSAPIIKRRAKSGKRRSGGSGGGRISDGGEEEAQNSDGKSRRSGGRGRPSLQTKVPDVVTMVSLVSSADSDSDIDQNSPRDDKLIHELRNKLPTTPIIKTSSTAGCTSMASTLQRKPIKSVSFQQESFDFERDENPKDERKWGVVGVFGQQKFPVVCRSGGSALPTPEEATSWKSDDAPPLSSTTARNEFTDPEDAFIAPVTDREKRCLAVPIGDPIRDKKRRLLRTKSTPPHPCAADERLLNSPVTPAAENSTLRTVRDQEVAIDKTTAFSAASNELPVPKTDAKSDILGLDPEPETPTSSSEPQFQTRKERECWHLYRRMCDKGVYVSFDTVLRGMLTPTEYRLRQKEASPSDC
ncbi:uncharacterized protein LOC124176897 [Neodiprion fabricii]|uniref:uncharacterized protein LOC124176897 n=1 Tax=Neodiprion fabricii TaxID=2872261 RepID=UPI001ED930F9|nr:uncharacterized protein LOC124176897 [Neodiprion fabricii]